MNACLSNARAQACDGKTWLRMSDTHVAAISAQEGYSFGRGRPRETQQTVTSELDGSGAKRLHLQSAASYVGNPRNAPRRLVSGGGRVARILTVCTQFSPVAARHSPAPRPRHDDHDNDDRSDPDVQSQTCSLLPADADFDRPGRRQHASPCTWISPVRPSGEEGAAIDSP